MKEFTITLLSTIALNLIGKTPLTFWLSAIGGFLLILNQYYTINRTVKKEFEGDWRAYFNSLKISRLTKKRNKNMEQKDISPEEKALKRRKKLFRILAALCVIFFVVFKVLIPWALNQPIDIQKIDLQILGVSSLAYFLIEVVIKIAAKRLEKRFGVNDEKKAND